MLQRQRRNTRLKQPPRKRSQTCNSNFTLAQKTDCDTDFCVGKDVIARNVQFYKRKDVTSNLSISKQKLRLSKLPERSRQSRKMLLLWPF
ncbi:hypothetical protein RIR_jg28018.t1 [Rhizophagus irregularis DAOM 181602=DAOM 197198]|nr:hypothetical protein RIR_jg28018.t1 [Rhizophagus irregularis DAOM 181602=DAOM 197198]CAB4487198.1 unnamed protein product [Rhizophagus irregularis]